MTYQFEPFGPGSTYMSSYFDRVFSVSTLEHIPHESRLGVLMDIHRCVAIRGLELHTIDIHIPPRISHVAVAASAERLRLGRILDRFYHDSIGEWVRLFSASGVRFSSPTPSPWKLLDRRTLVESPDVMYRFYEPVDAPTCYQPSASLLIVLAREK